jgi:hypothetical protein
MQHNWVFATMMSLMLFACNNQNTPEIILPQPGVPQISFTPTTMLISAGSSQTMTMAAKGLNSTAVNWQVTGLGTVSWT